MSGEDGHPRLLPLYESLEGTLEVSELTYAISLMRQLARNGQLEGDSNELALQLPVNAAHFQRVLDANPKIRDIMMEENENADLQYKAIADAKARNMRDPSMVAVREAMGRSSIMDLREAIGPDIEAAEARLGDRVKKDKAMRRGSVDMQAGRLVFFHDQDDKGYREQTEMVYGIGVNDAQKNVTVVFRGSRTPADWAQNKKFFGKQIKNPVKNLECFAADKTVPDKVYVHEGFHEYLHHMDGTPSGIFENLLPVLSRHPGYTLSVTGHSLGGGLANIFALEAACRTDIPKPVLCITHAQPLVGDSRLSRSAARLMESKNLYLLRLRNVEDSVPAVPAFSPKPSFHYCHMGMELKMYDDDRKETVKLSRTRPRLHDKLHNTKAMVTLFVIQSGVEKQKRAHGLGEHSRRLELYEKEIRALGDDLAVICSQ